MHCNSIFILVHCDVFINITRSQCVVIFWHWLACLDPMWCKVIGESCIKCVISTLRYDLHGTSRWCIAMYSSAWMFACALLGIGWPASLVWCEVIETSCIVMRIHSMQTSALQFVCLGIQDLNVWSKKLLVDFWCTNCLKEVLLLVEWSPVLTWGRVGIFFVLVKDNEVLISGVRYWDSQNSLERECFWLKVSCGELMQCEKELLFV